MRTNGLSMKESASGKELFNATDRSHWLSVPLRFAFNIKKGSENCQTQILFGPYVAVGLGGTTTIKNTETGIKDSSLGSFDKNGFYDRRFDVGLNVGVNFIIKRHFIVGLFGELGFVPLGNDMTHTIGGAFASAYTFNIGAGLNIGYRF